MIYTSLIPRDGSKVISEVKHNLEKRKERIVFFMWYRERKD